MEHKKNHVCKNRKSKISRKVTKKPQILEFNLSVTAFIGIIIFIIIAIATIKIITTRINNNLNSSLVGEATEGVTWVTTTERGSDGRLIKVPVPDGYTASKVPGETSVSGGFVIYEGDVNWWNIRDLYTYTDVTAYSESIDENSIEAKEIKSSEEESAGAENNTDASNSNVVDEINTNINVSNVINETDNTTTENIIENENNVVEENIAQNENTILETEQENSETAVKDIEKKENTEIDNKENVIDEKLEKESSETDTKDNENENIVTNEEISEKEDQKDEEKSEHKIKQEVENKEEVKKDETNTDKEESEISTLAIGGTPTTVLELQESVNQYVWVPVNDVSRIYGVDSNGKLWGKLYTYAKTSGLPEARGAYWTMTNGVMDNPGANYREPDVISRNANDRARFDTDSVLQGNLDEIKQYQLLAKELEENFYLIIKRIEKYGGFYIGRYETGNLGQEEVVIQKMNTDIHSQTWYTMYEKSKRLAGENENVMTSLMWGTLWDETLQWFLESEAQIQDGEYRTRTITEEDINENSDSWGNYPYTTFNYLDTSGQIVSKTGGIRIPTGSTAYTKVNNIYDMAGNVRDCRVESNEYSNRIWRGGNFWSTDGNLPASGRDNFRVTDFTDSRGCRSMLYIL